MRIFITIVVFLAACASTSTNTTDFESTAHPLKEDMGRVYVYRKGKMTGSAIRPAVKVNGVAVGQSAPSTYFYFDRAPGEYSMSCSVITDHTIRFTVEAGETVYVETRAAMGVFAGHIRPGIVTPKEGAAAASKCKYTGQ
jgi:hypothetical protein